MISDKEYIELRARLDRHEAWLGDRTSYFPEDVPLDCQVENSERSAVEVFEFCRQKPQRYFLYINEEKKLATTWAGDKLGTVELGRSYRDNFGGKRISVVVHGINGLHYHGTYFKSAGNYARIKAFKNS